MYIDEGYGERERDSSAATTLPFLVVVVVVVVGRRGFVLVVNIVGRSRRQTAARTYRSQRKGPTWSLTLWLLLILLG